MLDALSVLSLVPLLPAPECAAWIRDLEARGFSPTGRAYPPDYRDNDRLVFDDPELAREWEARLQPHLPAVLHHQGRVWRRVGLNPRFRACRYRGGQAFAIHRDGPWVPDGRRRSLLTVMLYLADPASYQGGETCFWSDPRRSTAEGGFRPPAGQALVFGHARWHEGRPVTAGTKWVLRTDVLYQVDGGGPTRGYLWDVALHRGRPAVAGRDGRVRHAGRVMAGGGGSILRVLSQPGRLVGGDREGALWAWPDDGGPSRRWAAHDGAVLALRQGPDGLWSAGADGVARRWQRERLLEEVAGDGWLWDLLPEEGGLVQARGELRALARHQGQVARGRTDGSIELGDRTWPAHEGAVRALSSTRWGLVSGGEDGAVRLWGDAGPVDLQRHEDFVTGLAVGRRRVWSTGYDGRLLWARL